MNKKKILNKLFSAMLLSAGLMSSAALLAGEKPATVMCESKEAAEKFKDNPIGRKMMRKHAGPEIITSAAAKDCSEKAQEEACPEGFQPYQCATE